MYKRLNGQVIHRSIPEASTKAEAEQAMRATIEDAFNKRYGIATQTETFAEFADTTYRRYMMQRNVNITAKKIDIAFLIGYFGKAKLLDEITAQDCRDAQYRLLRTPTVNKTPRSPSSVNRTMSTLSKIFSLACEEGKLERNPMQYVKSLAEPPPRRRLLTDKEKERLWAALDQDVLMLRFVNLALNLPLRRGQLLAICTDAIDFQNGLLSVIGSKGRSARLVPLNSGAMNTLQQMIADGQLPFPLKDFRKRWHRALIAAGINKPGGSREDNYHFHDLRKEFASNLIRKNVNPEIVQQLFAHSAMNITQAYMHSSIDDLSQAVRSLDETGTQESDIVQ